MTKVENLVYDRGDHYRNSYDDDYPQPTTSGVSKINDADEKEV